MGLEIELAHIVLDFNVEGVLFGLDVKDHEWDRLGRDFEVPVQIVEARMKSLSCVSWPSIHKYMQAFLDQYSTFVMTRSQHYTVDLNHIRDQNMLPLYHGLAHIWECISELVLQNVFAIPHEVPCFLGSPNF